MTEQLDLSAYLKDQADDGTKDSEGDFTISHQNARRKLAKFSLPRETAWVSKLVQAAVCWRMQKILLAQSKTETQFFFCTETPSDLPTEQDIVSNLLSGDVIADSPIEHFCLALRSLVEQAGLSFILAINGGEMEPRPVYAGPYYAQLSESERLDPRYNRALGVTLTVRHAPLVTGGTRLTELFDQSVHGIPIVEELRNFAYTCPIPIILSGMHIEGFLTSPLFQRPPEPLFQGPSVPLCLSGLKDLKESPERLSLPPCFEHKELSYLTHPRRAARSYGGGKNFAAAFVLTSLPHTVHADSSRYSSFSWIRDGIIVQSESLPIRSNLLGLHIFANAEGLGSDLTGFQLVQSEAKRLREQEIFSGLEVVIGQLSKRSEIFFRTDLDEYSQEDLQIDRDAEFRKRVKTLVSGSVLALLITLVNPPLGAAGTLAAITRTYTGEQLKSALKRHVLRGTADLKSVMEFDFEVLGKDLARLSHDPSGTRL